MQVPVFWTFAVCICSLWSVVFVQNVLCDSFGLAVKPPTCGCLCAQNNFTVPWKEFLNISPQIWKPSFNPTLWQSDEVLSAYLGPLVLLLLFFHWHHLSTFPVSSPILSCPPDQREKERETRLQELRQQRDERAQKSRAGVGAGEVVTSKVEKSADGSAVGQITKTNRFAQSGSFYCFPLPWTVIVEEIEFIKTEMEKCSIMNFIVCV